MAERFVIEVRTNMRRADGEYVIATVGLQPGQQVFHTLPSLISQVSAERQAEFVEMQILKAPEADEEGRIFLIFEKKDVDQLFTRVLHPGPNGRVEYWRPARSDEDGLRVCEKWGLQKAIKTVASDENATLVDIKILPETRQVILILQKI